MTKRIFAAVIAIAMVCTMFAFVTSAAAETTTVNLDASVTEYGWNQVINALGMNDWDKNEDNWQVDVLESQALRTAALWLVYGWELDNGGYKGYGSTIDVTGLACPHADVNNTAAFESEIRTFKFNKIGNATNVTVFDYMQNEFGAAAYALRGGKQKAIDLWNQYCSDQPAALDGDTAFTYTNNTKYTDESFANALACLKAYMTYAQDNQVCNVGTAGRWTAQKARYAALETALQALEEGSVTPDPTPEIVDLTGYTSADPVTQYLITYYNNIDVAEYRELEDTQNWARALKNGLDNGLIGNNILINGGTDVVTFWEKNLRYMVYLSDGARTAADKIYSDATLWPQGEPLYDKNQVVYKASQFNEVYDLRVRIRDEYRSSLTIKTSEVLAACEELKTKIQALETASLPFTQEQLEAKSVMAYYVPIYRGRVERVVLDSNKATDIYKNYVALVVKAEGYLALDWENGTSASYPSVEEMHALIEPGAMGGSLELDWYPFRLAFGLDTQGYDAVVAAAVAEWEASGLYTDASIAAVKEAVASGEVSEFTGARSATNTDALTQGDVEIYKAMLELKPALPEFKVASASLSLGESIAINFRVNADVYTSYENVYGVVECDGDEVRIEGVLCSDGRYMFTYSNLTPKMAKVPVIFTLYGTAGGQSYTKTVEYSIYKYCTNQFSRTTDEAFKTLLTDFINYAAALQVYTDYRTDDLANADFDQTYASATFTNPVNQLNATYATIDNPTVAWKGVSLSIQDTVNARLTFQAADITGLTIQFVINGNVYNVDTFTPVSGYTDRYYVYFGDILPREMRTAFTATAYVDGVVVSNTIQYSIQSYVVGKTDLGTNLSDLLVAMLKFGDACAAYFG